MNYSDLLLIVIQASKQLTTNSKCILNRTMYTTTGLTIQLFMVQQRKKYCPAGTPRLGKVEPSNILNCNSMIDKTTCSD